MSIHTIYSFTIDSNIIRYNIYNDPMDHPLPILENNIQIKLHKSINTSIQNDYTVLDMNDLRSYIIHSDPSFGIANNEPITFAPNYPIRRYY